MVEDSQRGNRKAFLAPPFAHCGAKFQIRHTQTRRIWPQKPPIAKGTSFEASKFQQLSKMRSLYRAQNPGLWGQLVKWRCSAVGRLLRYSHVRDRITEADRRPSCLTRKE